jgi:hypothetical protein
MIARHIAQPVILVALFAVAPSPVRSELPEAPAPRARHDGELKPWSELLVGTWKMSKMNGRDLPPAWNYTIAITKDGKFTMKGEHPREPQWTKNGTFDLRRAKIKFTVAAKANAPEVTWDVTTTALSQAELTLTAGQPTDHELNVLKRVKAE